MGRDAKDAVVLHELIYFIDEILCALTHIFYVVDRFAAVLAQFRIYDLRRIRIAAICVLDERDLLPHGRAASRWIVQVLKNHIGEAVRELLKCNRRFIGKDALNSKVLGIVEVRGL